MKSIRLLPIVIVAACALLLFKLVGLATSGGYVLVGTQSAYAQAHDGAAATALATTDGGVSAGNDPTLTDTDPVLQDTAPTLLAKADAATGSASAPPANMVAAKVDSHTAPPPEPSEKPAAAAADCPALSGADAGKSGDATHPPARGGQPEDAVGALIKLPGDCPPPSDAVAMTQDALGHQTPLAATGPMAPTDLALLSRLKQRSSELDAQARQLDMRSALLDAAQKKLDEREKALKALQAKIDSQVTDRQAAETEQFKAVVSMYETMKPADAATIFNTLDIGVLTRVAKAMNPRKMALVLAAMDPKRAQVLTVALATDAVPADTVVADTTGAGQLPQIVGH